MRVYAYNICVRNADKLNIEKAKSKSLLSHIFPKLFLEDLTKNYLGANKKYIDLYNKEQVGG